MADDRILIQLEVQQKGNKLSVVAKDTEKLGRATDKTTTSSEKLEKQSKKTYGRFEQGTIGTANATKSFSKLNQTIGGGGSGGAGALVGAYAVLAANIFAVTAAFGALSRAAAVEKLAEGLETFSNQTGQSLNLVARRLQEATGNAVSFEQAMTTAAVATSAGFGTKEMEGLTEVARNASLALGRDMGDALDRLTRGAIKLEPEILDELGIMVRLDDATENFAATLGKAAGNLTRFERQQAFVNAIITEGKDKFTALEDVDPNPYDRLSAAFADLTKNVLSFINVPLKGLVEGLLFAPGLFLGAVTLFAGGIVQKMIPAFGDMAQSAKNSAEASRNAIDAAINAGAGQQRAIAATMETNKEGLKTFDAIFGKIRQGTATTNELTAANRSLGQRIGKLGREQDAYIKQNGRANAQLTRRINLLKRTQQEIRNLRNAEVSAQATRALGIAEANLAFADAQVGVIAEAQRQTFGYRDKLKQLLTVFRGIGTAAKSYFAALFEVNTQTGILGIKSRGLSGILAGLVTGFKVAGLSVRAFGLILLQSIPLLGQVFFAFSIVKTAVEFLGRQFGFITAETEAAKRAMEDFQGVLDDIPKKFEALKLAQEKSTASTKVITAEFRVLGGLLRTLSTEADRTQASLNVAGKGTDSIDVQRIMGSVRQGNQPDFIFDEFKEVDAATQAIEKLEEQSERAANAVKALTKEEGDAAGKSLKEFVKNLAASGFTAQEMAKQTDGLLKALTRRFDGLAESVDGVKNGFQEAEKEVGKFIRSTAESTKFDQVFANISTIQRELAGVREQAIEGATDTAAVIGEAVQDIGTNVRILLGPEALAVGKKLNKEKEKLNKLIEKGLKLTGQDLRNNNKLVEEQEKIVKEQQKKQGEIVEKELPGVKNILRALTQQEITQKSLVKDVQQRIKLVQKLAAGEKAVLATQNLNNIISEEEIRGKKLLLRLNDGQIERAKKLSFEELSADKEAQAALALEKSLLQEIATLEDKITDDRITVVEAALAEVKEQEKLNKLIREEEKIRNQINNIAFETKNITLEQQGIETDKLTARTALRNFELAKEKKELAEKEARARMKVLTAENALFQAQNKVEQEKTKKEIDRIKTEEKVREESLKRMLALQRKRTDARLDQPDKETGELFDREKFTAQDENILNDLIEKNRELNQSNLSSQREAYETLLDALIDGSMNAEEVFKQTAKNNELTTKKNIAELSKAYNQFFSSLGENLLGQADGGAIFGEAMAMLFNPEVFESRLAEVMETMDSKIGATLTVLGERFAQFASLLESVFGEEGAGAVALGQFASATATGFGQIAEAIDDLMSGAATKAEAVGGILGGIATMMMGLANAQNKVGQQRIAAIDKEIEAEKKKDGKSKESQQKIFEMEKRKEAMARKQFEQQKKMQTAIAIINTATAAIGAFAALSHIPYVGPALGAAAAAAITAIGMAQVAMIQKQKYSGPVAEAPNTALNTTLSMGSRTNEVNVADTANRGELSYLRGEAGRGNISNFTPAASGRKGYANGSDGIVVGERGPEIITPSMPVDIIPNDQIRQGTTNVTFTIHAVDAAGLEQTIQSQRGNIIGMIRDAANGFGEPFLEGVDTDTLTGDGGSY